MPCRTCTASQGLEVCLFCGHSFCGKHRVDSGGVPICTACLEAEHARKKAAKAKPAFQPPAERSVEVGDPVEVVAQGKPMKALPEPGGKKALLFGLGAAVPTALYLYWFLGWLGDKQELPDWVQQGGTGVGAFLAFAGVWAIVKSRG